MEPNSYMEMKELERLDDPAFQNRCTRLKRTTVVQGAAGQLCIFLAVIAFFLWQRAYLGTTSRSGHFFPPNPAFIPWAYAATATTVIGLVIYLCVKNYYLLDPVEHGLFHCFSFLGWRRRRIVFRQGEILGITVAGGKRSSRYGSYWVYRVVAVGKDGRQEALCNWRRDGLEKCNSQAIDLARELDCPSSPAPEKSKPVVEMESGVPRLQFVPSGSGGAALYFLAIFAAFVIGLILTMISRRH